MGYLSNWLVLQIVDFALTRFYRFFSNKYYRVNSFILVKNIKESVFGNKSQTIMIFQLLFLIFSDIL